MMRIFWYLLYNGIFYPLLFLICSFLAIFQNKLRQGMIGRFNSIKILKEYFKVHDADRKVYWYHAASLGEFYQIKPIIEGCKERKKQYINILSFSSPSGMDNASSDAINLKFYLPFDFPWIIRRALKYVQPKKIIFASYDIWPNLLWMSKSKNIDLSIIAAKAKENSIKNIPIVKFFFRSLYRSFNSIYTITEKDKVLYTDILGDVVIPNVLALGNPRYDTVYKSSKNFIPEDRKILSDRDKYIIIGSSHFEDDQQIIPGLVNLLKNVPDLKILHAPHEPNQKNIARIQSKYLSLGYESTVFADLIDITSSNKNIIIVSKIGLLSSLYWYGQVAYIGGGFSTGIHNIMEPAIAGLPVIFGPRYEDFDEAKQMLELGGGFCVYNSIKFETTIMELFNNKVLFENSSSASSEVILKNIGSTEKIIDALIAD